MRQLSHLTANTMIWLMVLIAPLHPQTNSRQTGSLNALNDEAAATNSAGIRVYSEHLINLLPIRVAGQTYLSRFSDRLANAEALARQGKHKLISEKAIAEAFNELMRRTDAPSSLKADITDVEMSRRGFEKELPAMISESKNGKYCYPGEAVWVLGMLMENIGAHVPPSNPGPHVSGYVPPVRLHLEHYFSSHSPNVSAAVLDQLAKTLGI